MFAPSNRECSNDALRSTQYVLAIIMVASLAAACGTDGAEAEGVDPDDVAHLEHDDRADQPVGALTSETPDGVPVRLTLTPDPPLAGDVLLQVQVDGEVPDPDALTVDLVAPHMPAHGIVRFPVRVTAAGDMEAGIRVPMEGTWKVYVNLDSGAQAAPFQFQVAPGEGDHGHSGHDHHDHHHHSSAPEGGAAP